MVLKRVLADECEHEIKVTYLGKNTWGVRCFTNGELNQEIQVKDRRDIGTAAREMLRWEDKCGNISDFAGNSRDRNNVKKNTLRYFKPSKVIDVRSKG